MIKKIAKNKQQSTNRLEYMDPPVHPAPPPPTQAAEAAAPPAKTFVIPEAQPLSDEEVQIDIPSLRPTLIVPPVTGVRAAER